MELNDPRWANLKGGWSCHPDLPWLADALSKCRTACWESRAYVAFVDRWPSNKRMKLTKLPRLTFGRRVCLRRASGPRSLSVSEPTRTMTKYWITPGMLVLIVCCRVYAVVFFAWVTATAVSADTHARARVQ
jgi:hypothetical protein